LFGHSTVEKTKTYKKQIVIDTIWLVTSYNSLVKDRQICNRLSVVHSAR
jgi:hypothetical protein